MVRASMVAALVVTGCIASVFIGGCSIKARSIFFDGVDRGPPPPKTRVRRDFLKEIDALERELADTRKALEAAKAEQQQDKTAESLPAGEQAQTWSELMGLLPKGAGGQIDWRAALQTEAIKPRAGLDPKALPHAVFDLDIALNRTQSATLRALGWSAVTFRHTSHTQWLSCGNCHQGGFRITGTARDNVLKHEYCNDCHGKVAFAITDACNRCHLASP